MNEFINSYMKNMKNIPTEPYESREEAKFMQYIEKMQAPQVYAPNVPDSFKKMVSCTVNVQDSIVPIKSNLEIHEGISSGLAMIAPGDDILVPARASMAARAVDGAITVLLAKSREPKTVFKINATMNYTLKNVLMTCSPLETIEKDTKKPPSGRSQKQHNLIQAMNKR